MHNKIHNWRIKETNICRNICYKIKYKNANTLKTIRYRLHQRNKKKVKFVLLCISIIIVLTCKLDQNLSNLVLLEVYLSIFFFKIM
ncbi:hypothetical protein KSP40_PGU010796 [Platanthera guangdongensis]|uniref:Uncharacterized protein n=1 Tax=Platanthera guangdongensis TaxID=2320717 RepID=A0ABR2LIZ3_9ASPA